MKYNSRNKNRTNNESIKYRGKEREKNTIPHTKKREKERKGKEPSCYYISLHEGRPLTNDQGLRTGR